MVKFFFKGSYKKIFLILHVSSTILYSIMRNLLLCILLILVIQLTNAQDRNVYRTGVSAEENLKAIANIEATSIGGVGFDTRYEGIKGSPMLFDTLYPSLLKMNNQDSYIQIESNIDLLTNSVKFLNPKTKQMISVSGNRVEELIISKGKEDLVFRTMEGTQFKKNSRDQAFYQVLNDDPYQLIKVPFIEFREADYKQAYSSGRKYDEFNKTYKYYIISADGIVRQCQLSEKSLIKIFPDKKELIKKVTTEKSFTDKEEMVMGVLKNF